MNLIVILAAGFILLIVFHHGMRDLFPAQYRSFTDSQQSEWNRMEIIPFPRIQKFVRILLRVTYCYAALLLTIVSVSAFVHSSQLVQVSTYMCAYGGAILMSTLLIIRIYVMIKGNSKTSQNLESDGSWGLLFLYFMGMSYWIQTLM